MKEGKIFEIIWDDSCSGCKKDRCINYESNSMLNFTQKKIIKNCNEDIKFCSDDPSSNHCDPKFYVTWFGSDKKKRQLQSSSLAMTKFKRYSTTSLYKSIRDIFKDTIRFVEGKWNLINNYASDIIKNKGK